MTMDYLDTPVDSPDVFRRVAHEMIDTRLDLGLVNRVDGNSANVFRRGCCSISLLF